MLKKLLKPFLALLGLCTVVLIVDTLQAAPKKKTPKVAKAAKKSAKNAKTTTPASLNLQQPTTPTTSAAISLEDTQDSVALNKPEDMLVEEEDKYTDEITVTVNNKPTVIKVQKIDVEDTDYTIQIYPREFETIDGKTNAVKLGIKNPTFIKSPRISESSPAGVFRNKNKNYQIVQFINNKNKKAPCGAIRSLNNTGVYAYKSEDMQVQDSYMCLFPDEVLDELEQQELTQKDEPELPTTTPTPLKKK